MEAQENRETAQARIAHRLLLLLMVGVAVAGAAGGVRAWLRQDSEEARRLAEQLHLQPGMVVADVGAGDGNWVRILSEQVGPSGRVFATEVNENLVKRLQSSAASWGNVSVAQGTQTENGLPTDCCAAILLRLVYHHFTDPAAMQAEFKRALRSGGLIAVIDQEPSGQRVPARVPQDRGGHGISPDLLIKEMMAAGFDVVGRFDDWPGSRDTFCVIFREP